MYIRYEETHKVLFTRTIEPVEMLYAAAAERLGLIQAGRRQKIRPVPGRTYYVTPYVDRHGRTWERVTP